MVAGRVCGAAVVALAGLALPALAAAAVCPPLVWTTLGTAGGPVPTPERGEPANLLEAGAQQILVDTGDGSVNQLAKAGVTLGQVRSVFLSHHHHDHTGGLAAVVGLNWMNQFRGVLTVYGPPGTGEIVDAIVTSLGPQARIGFGLGEPPTSPDTSVRVVEIVDGQTVDLAELAVTAVANTHFDRGGRAHAAAPQSLSYRFQLGRRSITYTGDTGPSEGVTRLARGSDLLVSEVIDLDRLMSEIRRRRTDATPLMLNQMQRHLSTHHLPADAIGRMAKTAGVAQVVLTHFAVPPGPLSASESQLRSGISSSYEGPVELAQDLSRFEVPCKR